VERFTKVAAYVVLAIMAIACVLLLLHYGGIIVASSPEWLWGFVWGPVAIAAAVFFIVWLALSF
jgi:hypothetical protein